MSRRVAVVKFSDGHCMYGVFETTTNSIGQSIWATEQAATNHLDTGVSRLIQVDPKNDEELVEILPYALSGDDTVYFCSRASRIVGTLTGPRCLDDVTGEIRASEY